EKLAKYAADYRKRTGSKPKIGGDTMFFGRPEWKRIKELYGVAEDAFEIKEMDPTLMYGAVKDDQVQVIVAYNSDGRIPAFDLKVLRDTRQGFPPYDAVLLLSPEASRRPGVREALDPLIGAIDLDVMRQANRRVDVEKWTARRSAQELLQQIAPKE